MPMTREDQLYVCAGRQPFNSFKEAERALRNLVARGNVRPPPGYRVTPYLCAHCRYYHLAPKYKPRRFR